MLSGGTAGRVADRALVLDPRGRGRAVSRTVARWWRSSTGRRPSTRSGTARRWPWPKGRELVRSLAAREGGRAACGSTRWSPRSAPMPSGLLGPPPPCRRSPDASTSRWPVRCACCSRGRGRDHRHRAGGDGRAAMTAAERRDGARHRRLGRCRAGRRAGVRRRRVAGLDRGPAGGRRRGGGGRGHRGRRDGRPSCATSATRRRCAATLAEVAAVGRSARRRRAQRHQRHVVASPRSMHRRDASTTSRITYGSRPAGCYLLARHAFPLLAASRRIVRGDDVGSRVRGQAAAGAVRHGEGPAAGARGGPGPGVGPGGRAGERRGPARRLAGDGRGRSSRIRPWSSG